MIFKRFLVAAMLLLTGCQFSASITPVPTSTPLPTLPPTPKATATSSPSLKLEMNNVTLTLWRPSGWDSDDSDRGIIVAEGAVPAANGLNTGGGMLIYCSVAADSDDGASNRALQMLKQIVGQQNNKSWDATMTPPDALIWDGNDAAYYLFTSGDGVRAIVIAVAVPHLNVVLCTISAPIMQANRIREQLPQLLDGMTINVTTLHGTGLNSLPDPLPFPRYVPPSSTPQATAPSTSVPTAQP